MSPWLPILVWASKDNPFHSHITIVTFLIWASKDNPSFSPCRHSYLSSPGHQRTTRFTHTSPWLPSLSGHQRTAHCFLHFTMVICPHMVIKGQPVLLTHHHGYLPHLGIKGQPVFFSISPWLPVLTLASKENLDTGMFSGPPWTSKCLQPALAST